MTRKAEPRLEEGPPWAIPFGAAITTTMLVSVGLVASFGWPWYANFLQNSAAAWVQAIGSIAAIHMVFAIFRAQSQAQKERDAEAERQWRRQRLAVCLAILDRAAACFESDDPNATTRFAVRLLPDEVEHATQMLVGMPLTEIPDALLVHRFGLLGQSLAHQLAQIRSALELSPALLNQWVPTLAKSAATRYHETMATRHYCNALLIANSNDDEREASAEVDRTFMQMEGLATKLNFEAENK